MDSPLPREIVHEHKLLGLTALDQVAGEVLGAVSDLDFPDGSPEQSLYRVFQRQHAAGGIDPILAARQLSSHAHFDGDVKAATGWIRELIDNSGTAALLGHSAAVVKEVRLKRQLYGIGQSIADAALNGKSATTILDGAFADIEDLRRATTANTIRFRTYTASELDLAEFPVSFLVRNFLVAGMPCGLGGYEKTLKTTLMLALGVSLVLRQPFLGEFEVDEQKRFLMFSGESGLSAIQETCRRICRSYGCELSDLDGFVISPDLPELGNEIDMVDFEAIIAEHEPDVVAVDPMYLCLGDVDEKAANMFSMARPLKRLNQACEKHGATLMFAHHFSGIPQYGATPKISQFAYSGFKQFLRQWILLNRMEEYTPGTGLHRLKLVAGGNVGHGGLWIAEVDEGTRHSLGGRYWRASVKSVDDAKQESSTRSAQLKAEAADAASRPKVRHAATSEGQQGDAGQGGDRRRIRATD